MCIFKKDFYLNYVILGNLLVSLFLHNFHCNIFFKRILFSVDDFSLPRTVLSLWKKINIIHTFTREHARAFFAIIFNCLYWIVLVTQAHHKWPLSSRAIVRRRPPFGAMQSLVLLPLLLLLGFFRKKRNEIVFKNCVHFVSSFCVCFKVRFVLTNGSTVLFNLISSLSFSNNCFV